MPRRQQHRRVQPDAPLPSLAQEAHCVTPQLQS
jgi:hypothetical protein